MKKFTLFVLILAGITIISAAQTVGPGAFRQEGIASWYGSEFDGKPTASGEIFDSTLFTAAHPNLPFGTVLEVTNKQNNRQVIVLVNDRGPFVSARIVDLSQAAADVLDMIKTGTAPVVITEQSAYTALGPVSGTIETNDYPVAVSELTQAISQTAEDIPETGEDPQQAQALSQTQPQPAQQTQQPQQAQQTQTQTQTQQVQQTQQPQQAVPAYFPAPAAELKGLQPQAGSTRLYRLQVGSYRIPRNATDAFEKLRKAGLDPSYEQYGEFYRVVLAGIKAGDIPSIAQTLGNIGYREVVIRNEPGR